VLHIEARAAAFPGLYLPLGASQVHGDHQPQLEPACVLSPPGHGGCPLRKALVGNKFLAQALEVEHVQVQPRQLEVADRVIVERGFDALAQACGLEGPPVRAEGYLAGVA